MLEVPGRQMACLKMTSYAPIEDYGVACKRLNGEFDKKDFSGDDASNTD